MNRRLAAILAADIAGYSRLMPLLLAERLPPLTLRGFEKPVTAYRVDGMRSVEAGARGIPGLTSPVMGRDAETESLRRGTDGRGWLCSR